MLSLIMAILMLMCVIFCIIMLIFAIKKGEQGFVKAWIFWIFFSLGAGIWNFIIYLSKIDSG